MVGLREAFATKRQAEWSKLLDSRLGGRSPVKSGIQNNTQINHSLRWKEIGFLPGDDNTEILTKMDDRL